MSVRTYGNALGRLSSDTGSEDTPFFSTNAPLSEYVLHRLSVMRTGWTGRPPNRIPPPSAENAHRDCLCPASPLTTAGGSRSSVALISIKDIQLARTKGKKLLPPTLQPQHKVSALGDPCTQHLHAVKQLTAHSLNALPAGHQQGSNTKL